LLKGHHQAALTRALKNARPMDFHVRAQLLRDIRDHAVEIRSVSVNQSACDRTLKPCNNGGLMVGYGFRQVVAMRDKETAWISTARGNCYSECRKPVAPGRVVAPHAGTVS